MEDQDSILSDLEPTEIESSYTQRFFSRLIDTAIELGLLFGILFISPKGTFSRVLDGRSLIVLLIVIIGYKPICLLAFDRTIGMILCRLKFLNEHFEPLSIRDKLLTFLPVNMPGVKYYKVL
jgi:uncharacterized RDD family membrane protein YckC